MASGWKHTEEWKRKRRLRKRTPEEKKRVSESLKLAYKNGRKRPTGTKHSEETRRKMSEAHTLRVKLGLNNFWKGGIAPTYKKRRQEFIRNNGGCHSKGEWETLKAQYNWTCVICKETEPKIKLTKDHIIPVSKGGSSNIENIQPLCQPCNSRKNDKLPI